MRILFTIFVLLVATLVACIGDDNTRAATGTPVTTGSPPARPSGGTGATGTDTPAASAPATSSPTAAAPIQQIAFTSDRDGNNEIYVMNADGSSLRRLTENPASDSSPAWSPDGNRIVFTSDRDGNSEIYVMNADGTNQINLSDRPALDQGPTWSPDGKLIAYDSLYGSRFSIHVMNADGSNNIRVTDDGGSDQSPIWSPDSTRIAFASVIRAGMTPAIYAVNADGSELTPLAANPSPASETHPTWSPDGTRIAYVLGGSGGALPFEIYGMSEDGSNQTRLTPSTIDQTGFSSPAWSPDGRRIAFIAFDGDNNGAIYVMDADSLEQTRLVESSARTTWLAWSPDGDRLVSTSIRDGNLEIYIVNGDGSGLTNLTDHPANDYSPSWSASAAEGPRLVTPATAPSTTATTTPNATGTATPNTTVTVTPSATATGTASPTAGRVYDPATDQCLEVLDRAAQAACYLALYYPDLPCDQVIDPSAQESCYMGLEQLGTPTPTLTPTPTQTPAPTATPSQVLPCSEISDPVLREAARLTENCVDD